jgi:Pentapeptide repeats (8 copies)
LEHRQAIDLLGSGRRGVARWNAWWRPLSHRAEPFDLSGARLEGAYLEEAFLFRTNLTHAVLARANLHKANLNRAQLSGAILTGANLMRASLNGAQLMGARLMGADLYAAQLRLANLRAANLQGASLQHASLTRVKFVDATLDGCGVFGASVWDVDLAGASQKGLVITPAGEPAITVDNLKVAQFIYLLLDNPEIRDVIDTITSKVVLILGRFTARRKPVLDALRTALRDCGYSPVLFDFERPRSRSFREAISTLAHMARFVIADLTDAKVVLQELERIVPDLPSVPVQTILQSRAKATVVVDEDYSPYPWFLPRLGYRGATDLVDARLPGIIAAAEGHLQRSRAAAAAQVPAAKRSVKKRSA